MRTKESTIVVGFTSFNERVADEARSVERDVWDVSFFATFHRITEDKLDILRITQSMFINMQNVPSKIISYDIMRDQTVSVPL